MSLHLRKYQAHVEASRLEIDAAEQARSRKHSSGHRYRRFGVRRKFLFLWEAFEHSPHARPRV